MLRRLVDHSIRCNGYGSCRCGVQSGSARACSSSFPAPSETQPVHPTVYMSGIQPTGIPHIGNYFGAIRPWLGLQEEHSSHAKFFLGIVDMHAVTMGPRPADELRQRVFEMAASLIAAGVDPKKTTLFRQSTIPEIAQLSWILCTLQSVPKLQRLPQFKEKAGKFARSGVPLGLLSYPVLQAADVLAFRATHVPVGKDQSQHLNLLTDLALIFNTAYHCHLFPIPKAVFADHARIKSLKAPHQKMSKSESSERGRIGIVDSSQDIMDKCRRAQSDAIPELTYEPGRRTAVANLIDLLAAVRNSSPEKVFEETRDLNIVQLKETLAVETEEMLRPIRDKYTEILKDREAVYRILREGEEESRSTVADTMKEVMTLVGFR